MDHASRTIAFAKELTEILQRFNDQHDAHLALRVGIDSGPVTSGLVGERSTIYALWGEAVDLAHRVPRRHQDAGVFVSDRVHGAVGGSTRSPKPAPSPGVGYRNRLAPGHGVRQAV